MKAFNAELRKFTGKGGRATVRNIPPHSVEAAYRVQLDKLIVDLNREYRDNIAPQLKAEIEMRDKSQRVDSITDVILAIRNLVTSIVPGAQLAYDMAQKVFTFNNRKFTGPISQKIGVAVNLPEGKTTELMQSWMLANEMEIERIQKNHVDRMLAIVQRGWEDGLSYQSITDQLVKQTGVARNYAKFVARDQVGNLNGALTRERNEQLGVEKFKWRTSEDERVRGDPSGRYPKAKPSHYKFANHTYDWKDGTGVSRAKFPGSDYQCRCYAESVIEW
ncbi:head morphogenesis domain protein [Vibrio phage 1.123.O._10N.286.48.F3]|nr:head morphogenesis domain protein [Vibrio phage 1.123.O._10N.286.48.F3]